mgnify:CR=1 FL=1
MGNELCAPPDVENDPNALEILRVWVADGVLQLSVDISVFEAPEDYGILLAGLGNHFLNAMTMRTDIDKEEALSTVLKQIGQKYKQVQSRDNGNG